MRQINFHVARALFLLTSVFLSFAWTPLAHADPTWMGYAGDPQHTADSSVASQPLQTIHWSTPLDLAPPSGTLFIHYGSPVITASNTVILPVKTTPSGGFRIEARSGSNGALIWSANDFGYSVPQTNWFQPLGPALTPGNRLYYAGPGGTVFYRDNPDAASGPSGQIAFYGTSVYNGNPTAFNNSVRISTPITSDKSGNIYFGYEVSSAVTGGPTGSGIAKIDSSGNGAFTSITSLVSSADGAKVARSCAPAVSIDGTTLYFAVNGGTRNASGGDLVSVDTATLGSATGFKNAIRLTDPRGGDAWVNDSSSASPTVGPDGRVYYGVLEANFPSHVDRGWMLQFKSDLSGTSGVPGSFGWDDTVSIVPTSMLGANYSGSSPYLLMSKYNNYHDFPLGDGKNEVAILDPFASESDPIIPSVSVMKEVITQLGLTPDPTLPQVREWCINSAVVDPGTDSALVNSEDGKLYRWNLGTNSFTQIITLTAGIGEAYTPTLIGSDGAVYAINDSILFSIGSAVPEPSSAILAMIGSAIGVCAWWRRSRG